MASQLRMFGKKQGERRQPYSNSNLQKALQDIEDNGTSFRTASAKWGVPKSTLSDKIHKLTPRDYTRPGPSTILTGSEEEILEQYCLNMCEIGYGKTKRQILDHVKVILDDPSDVRQVPVPFKNNRPGDKWFGCFLRRHPKCSLRYGEIIGRDRAQVTPQRLDKWYSDFQDYVSSEDESLLSSPSRIFNADEAGFALQGKSERILAPRGSKNVYQVKSQDKTQITVLACISAAGVYVPPLIIAPGTRLRYDPTDGGPEGACLGKSPSGWINSEVFYEWVANHFNVFVESKGIEKPVLLLVDGHAAHINVHTAEFCHHHDIILYCLPPSSSHITQPCDVGLFSSMKVAWKQSVSDFQAANIGEFVTKKTFGQVLKRTWELCAKPSTAANAFKATGLYPYDPKAYDSRKVRPSSIYAPRSLEEPSTMFTNSDAVVPQDEAALPEVGAVESREEELEATVPQFEAVEVEGSMETYRDEDESAQAQLESREEELEAAVPQFEAVELEGSMETYRDEDESAQAQLESREEELEAAVPQFEAVELEGSMETYRDEDESAQAQLESREEELEAAVPQFEAVELEDLMETYRDEDKPDSQGSMMSLGSDHDSTDIAGTTRSIDNTFVSPAFEKHLHYPSQVERKRPLSDRQKQKMQLPHAVSGDEYRKFLRETQEKKEEEARQKEEREQKRIEKRKEKEEEAERKKREQERKKHERELKKLEVERKKLEAEKRRLEATRKKNEMEQKKLRREKKKQKKRQKKRQGVNMVKESCALDEENEPVLEEPDEVVHVRERRKRKAPSPSDDFLYF